MEKEIIEEKEITEVTEVIEEEEVEEIKKVEKVKKSPKKINEETTKEEIAMASKIIITLTIVGVSLTIFALATIFFMIVGRFVL